jgi:hypothetical protein
MPMESRAPAMKLLMAPPGTGLDMGELVVMARSYRVSRDSERECTAQQLRETGTSDQT